jgi:multidrug resistance efflux pump
MLLITATVCILIYVPWQQSVVGTGQVFVYQPMDRPQNIEAQIPGRLVAWYIREGEMVQKGAVIARIEDIDNKFLDSGQIVRLQEQKTALLNRRAAAQSRVAALSAQLISLDKSRNVGVPAAKERAKQAMDRLKAAQQAYVQAQQAYRNVQEASVPIAEERRQQAQERIVQAEQAVAEAEQTLRTSRLNRTRVNELYRRMLRSQRDDELAELDLVKSQTSLERAKRALEVAKRDANVTQRDITRADTDLERAKAEVDRAQAAVDLAQKDTGIGALDAIRVENDTAAALDSVRASIASAQETIASVTSDLAKLEVEIANLRRRVGQQVVTAPATGRLVRQLKVGAGETVKAGDILAVLMPKVGQTAVELYLDDFDAPLVTVGRPVRLQFAGYPAVQLTGVPSAAVGTFAGKVAVIDAVDSGNGKFRIVVEPDFDRIASGKDKAWPNPGKLRPGAGTIGWVMLERVPLYYEIWRRFNAFPPMIPSDKWADTKGSKSDDAKNGKPAKAKPSAAKSSLK